MNARGLSRQVDSRRRGSIKAGLTVLVVVAIIGLWAPAAHADGWKVQASYPYQSWCVAAGKFWVGFSGNLNDVYTKITAYRCTYNAGRPWNSRWQLSLYRVY